MVANRRLTHNETTPPRRTVAPQGRMAVGWGLGFSKADRDENIRCIRSVVELPTRHRVVALVAATSPYRDVRAEVQRRIGHFVKV